MQPDLIQVVQDARFIYRQTTPLFFDVHRMYHVTEAVFVVNIVAVLVVVLLGAGRCMAYRFEITVTRCSLVTGSSTGSLRVSLAGMPIVLRRRRRLDG
jgi:hypothetical protein